MKTFFSIVVFLALPLPAPAANPPEAIANEALYLRFQKEFLRKAPQRLRPGKLSARMQRLALDAMEDLVHTGISLPLDSILAPDDLPLLKPREASRWYRLRFGGSRNEETETALLSRLRSAEASPELLYELYRLSQHIPSSRISPIIEEMENRLPVESATWKNLTAPKRAFSAPGTQEVQALWNENANAGSFQDGSYASKPRLFMFCRHDRRQKCLLALRDHKNRAVRKSNGSLWTQQALGLSSRGLPFNQRNGYTPQGVHLIRGVMPEANFPQTYGRYRRLILDFAPRSSDEAEQKKLLPKLSHQRDWWKEAVIARDIGRGELRIHGTGQKNGSSSTPYYPFVPTIGCVAQKELRYDSTTYVDQRLLLDTLMRASDLSAVYANEPLIQGLLYVIELSEGGGAVTAADLARFGIN